MLKHVLLTGWLALLGIPLGTVETASLSCPHLMWWNLLVGHIDNAGPKVTCATAPRWLKLAGILRLKLPMLHLPALLKASGCMAGGWMGGHPKWPQRLVLHPGCRHAPAVDG